MKLKNCAKHWFFLMLVWIMLFGAQTPVMPRRRRLRLRTTAEIIWKRQESHGICKIPKGSRFREFSI